MSENCDRHWDTCPLSSKCNLSGGYGFPDRFQGDLCSDLPFIKVSDMNLRGNEKFIRHAKNYVTYLLAEKMLWRPFPANTVVFAKVGAALKLNRRRILSNPTLIDNNMMAAEPLPELNPTFLYHFLNNIDFGEFVQDGALPSINQTQVGCIRIPEIAIEQQHAIATILDTVDDTIQRTEDLIEKLRRVKTGMLHDLLTCGLDENGELRDPIRHPEQFKDSPLGKTPQEWNYVSLRDVTEKIVDGVHFKPVYQNTGIPFLTVENLTSNDQIDFSNVRYVAEKDHRLFIRRADPKPNDVLVTKDGTLGVARTVPDDSCEFSIFVSLALLRPKTADISASWIRTFFDSTDFFAQLGTLSAGTGLKHIHLEHFRTFGIRLPSLDEQGRIKTIVQNMDRYISLENGILAKLKSLKQGLMQDLLSGHVRVTNLQEMTA